MTKPVKQLLEENISQCLQTPISVSTLRRLYLNSIKYLFSTTRNYYSDDGEKMQCLTWNPDQTGGVNYLDITLGDNFDPKSLNPAPSIVVATKNLILKKISQNDYAGTNQDKSETFYNREATLPLEFIQTATTSAEATTMSDLVMDHLQGTRPLILGKFAQSIMGIEVMGQQAPAKGGATNADWKYSVVVDMLIVFNYVVSVKTESRRMRGASIELIADHIPGTI